MLNWVFLFLIAAAVVVGSLTGTMKEVGDASFAAAKTSVDIVISLIGQITLWLGLMRILQQAGLMRSIGHAITPVMRRLFPEVPPDHPAMGAMVMNLAANMAGLGNAATPFGLKAMRELNRLNPFPGVATNAMALFLAINTSGVAVLPLGVIAIRAAMGSKNPAAILVPSIVATSITTIVAVIMTKFLEKLPRYAPQKAALESTTTDASDTSVAGLDKAEEVAVVGQPMTTRRKWLVFGVSLAVLIGLGLQFSGWKLTSVVEAGGAASQLSLVHTDVAGGALETARRLMSDWLIPLLILAIVLFGFGRQVKVYEAFIAGAKEGFQIAISIIPFLVAILVAVGMFRASGAMAAVTAILKPVLSPIGIPPEVLMMGLMRPLSGSGAQGVMTDIMKDFGPDSLIGYTVGVMNGSSETTFYVLAVYLGSVQVRAARHTLPACLISDSIGLLGAVYVSRFFFSPV